MRGEKIILENKNKITFAEGFEQYRLAIKYKGVGAYVQAIEVLTRTLKELSCTNSTWNEIHLISVLQDRLADVYVETNEFEKALYFFKKSLAHIDLLLKHDNQDSIILYKNQALKVRDMAFLYQALHQHDKAIVYFKKAIARYELLIKFGGEGDDEIFFIERELKILNSKINR